jgi:hypothetical protein
MAVERTGVEAASLNRAVIEYNCLAFARADQAISRNVLH